MISVAVLHRFDGLRPEAKASHGICIRYFMPLIMITDNPASRFIIWEEADCHHHEFRPVTRLAPGGWPSVLMMAMIFLAGWLISRSDFAFIHLFISSPLTAVKRERGYKMDFSINPNNRQNDTSYNDLRERKKKRRK